MEGLVRFLGALRRVAQFGVDLPRELSQLEQNVAEKFRSDNDAVVKWGPVATAAVLGTANPNSNKALASITYAAPRGAAYGMISFTVQVRISSPAGNPTFCSLDLRVDAAPVASQVAVLTGLYFAIPAGPFLYDTALSFTIPIGVPDAAPHRYDVFVVTDANTTAFFGTPTFAQSGNFSLWMNN
jgi:hypothetical protein